MHKIFTTSFLALALATPVATLAAPVTYTLPEENAVFKDNPGMDIAQNNCTACHSTDYINYQPPKMGPDFWNAEVQKMIKVYGAPVNEADAKAIADYLAATY